MTGRDDIDRFIGYFKTGHREIEKVARMLLKKILYLVEIDALSRAAFPTVSGNRKRVVQFIDTCSNWNDKDKVSAVQLKLALKKNGIMSGKLYDSINRQINSWGYGTIPRPTDDLTLEEAQRLSTTSESKHVNDARYAELLYTYRNYLLHEFREPGKSAESVIRADPTTPYYHGLDDLGVREDSWELVFPLEFIQGLCEACIRGLEAYLIANNLNPYDSFEYGTMWRRYR